MESAEQSEKDLQRAELVSLPIAAVVLLLVFGAVLAAGTPLFVAGLAIPASLALIYLVAQQVEMSIYVLNIATMLGLALAIDYSLFITSRFKEELRHGRTVGDAVQRSVATAGKAVVFSGLAVAIGLSGLMLFAAPAIRSIGIGGSIVVLTSVLFALTFLPAFLGMVGPRVNSWSPGGLLRRFRPVDHEPTTAERGRWERVANGVMRHPVAVLVPTLLVLLLAGIPFLQLRQGVPGPEVNPPGLESRDAYVALDTEFAAGETTPIIILADVPGSPTSVETIAALRAYSDELAGLDGIDRVEGPFSIRDPQTGTELTPEQVAALYALPADQQPPGLDALRQEYIRDGTVRLDAISPISPSQPEATDLIPTIRADRRRRRHHHRGRWDDGGRLRLPRVAVGARPVGRRADAARERRDPVPAVRLGRHPGEGDRHDPAVDHRELRRPRVHLPGRQLLERPQLHPDRLHGRGQPDHHVRRPVRPVDGLRGPAPVPHAGGVPPDRRQPGFGRRRPRPDGRRHHRRGDDHGHGVRGVRPRRRAHDQGDRRRHGDRGVHRRDDHSGPARAGDHAADGQVELVGAGLHGPLRRPARVQPRRGRAGTGTKAGDQAGARARLSPSHGSGKMASMDDHDGQVTRLGPDSGGQGPGEPTVRVYSWEWGSGAGRQPGLPWIGIFLLVFGGLLLIQQLFPEARALGSLLFVAIGLAFLVKWAIDRGTGSLYAGAIITALAAPGLIEEAMNATYDGLGTLCLGIAFLFIAVVRAATSGGIGWQAWLGGALAIIGVAEMVTLGIGDLVVPLVLVLLGGVLILRGTAAAR